MSGVALAILAVVTSAVAALATGWLRGYARRRSLIDLPNSRSAHDTPTPRGGGVAIVLAFIAALVVLATSGVLPLPVAFAIGGAGMIVALVGFWDDHGHIAAGWRLLAHFFAAAWLLTWFGGFPGLGLLESLGMPTLLAYVAVAFVIVWLINLYNFMDGIDGIASIEAVTACFGSAVVAIVAGHEHLVPLYLLLAASVSGFLLWNWPPAGIFMGDVGSGFLGAVITGLVLWSGLVHPPLLFAWIILLAVFVVDSGVTLLRRAARGERLYEAHRMHAYQHAARLLNSHRIVTIVIGLINFFWLLPLAVASVLGWLPTTIAVLVAYLPVLVLALRWKSGLPELTAADKSLGSNPS